MMKPIDELTKEYFEQVRKCLDVLFGVVEEIKNIDLDQVKEISQDEKED